MEKKEEVRHFSVVVVVMICIGSDSSSVGVVALGVHDASRCPLWIPAVLHMIKLVCNTEKNCYVFVQV